MFSSNLNLDSSSQSSSQSRRSHHSKQTYIKLQSVAEREQLSKVSLPLTHGSATSRPVRQQPRRNHLQCPLVGLESVSASPMIKTESSANLQVNHPRAYALPVLNPLRTTATMAGKRSSSPDAYRKSKKQRADKANSPEDFSQAVRKKLESSKRTCQACDRCKMRKIRCDSLPGGCTMCAAVGKECVTTDRNSGRSTARGYIENIEQENNAVHEQLRKLQEQLRARGIEINALGELHDVAPSNMRGQPWSSHPAPSTPQPPNISSPSQQNVLNISVGAPPSRGSLAAETIVNNFIGVSAGNSKLSAIKGTSLSILGMSIDIVDFKSLDMDEPQPNTFNDQLYNKSYQAFLQSAFNINVALEEPRLPSRNEAFNTAETYFRALNPYIPLLHRPTFLNLLSRHYDDPKFKPTAAETVMIHMVFALMYFQRACRNLGSEQSRLHSESNAHYHYSLRKFYLLSCSHTVEDVQALTLLCSHLRNFPKPGASWILTQTTLSVALELDMHRSVAKMASDTSLSTLDVEMRKRIFWSLLAIHVTLSGKLGRPMGLRMEDFDVEIPQEIDDELISHNGIDTSKTGICNHRVGLNAFRILPLFMELYSTIYTVRRQPDNYIATVKSLESKLWAWNESVHGNEVGREQENRAFHLYCKLWALEFRLLLRHPSVSMTNDETFNAESMTICVESSRQMLRVVQQLQELNCLDTTWYQCAVYITAITISLYAQYEKRSPFRESNLQSVKEEMVQWLEVMKYVGQLLGSGLKLYHAVKNVVDGTVSLLSHGLPSQTGQRPKAITNSRTAPEQSSPSSINVSNRQPDYTYANGSTVSPNGVAETRYPSTEGLVPQRHHVQYPPDPQYGQYREGDSHPGDITYTPQQNYIFSSSTADEAPLLANFAQQNSQLHPATWHRRGSQAAYAAHAQWHSFTNDVVQQAHPYADGLMQLQIQGGPQSGMMDHSQLGGPISLNTWPESFLGSISNGS